MSGNDFKKLATEAVDQVRNTVTELANRSKGEASSSGDHIDADADSPHSDIEETTSKARREAGGETKAAKSRVAEESGGLSDRVVDALDQAGNKFGGLINKAKGAFNDATKKD